MSATTTAAASLARAANATELLRPLRYPRLRRLLGKALHLSRTWQTRRRYDAYALEFVRGVPVVVTPGVFNPQLLRTGAYFAAQLTAELIAPGAEVLDLGTGSGICALIAAAYARRVVAVDISQAAVRCAAANALLNRLEQRIEVRHGDLFAPVLGESFDVVLFNPPFFKGVPAGELDQAWRSTDVPQRFAAGLRAHLKPAGRAYLLLSSFGETAVFVDELVRQRFAIGLQAERQFINERLSLLTIRPA